MGLVKDWMIEEEIRKREAIESVPDRLEDALVELGQLRERLEGSDSRVKELQDELRVTNSFKAKIKDYLVAGAIGAVIGVTLSAIFL